MHFIKPVKVLFHDPQKSTVAQTSVYEEANAGLDFCDRDIKLIYQDAVGDKKLPVTIILYKFGTNPVTLAEPFGEIMGYWILGRSMSNLLPANQVKFVTDFIMNTPGISVTLSLEELEAAITKFSI